MIGPYQNLSDEQKSKLITYLIEGNDIEDICEMFLETLPQAGLDELLTEADKLDDDD